MMTCFLKWGGVVLDSDNIDTSFVISIGVMYLTGSVKLETLATGPKYDGTTLRARKNILGKTIFLQRSYKYGNAKIVSNPTLRG